MNIAINREHCVDGLQKASNITPAKAGAAMLRTMWIRTDRAAKTISLMATDASTEYIGTYPAEVDEDGLVGVQAKSITDLLRALPEGIVNMATDESGHNLVISQGKRLYKLPTSNAEWFQPFSPFPEENTVTWSGEVLISIIDRVFFCIMEDDDSPLGCLYIRPKQNGEIDFCGLDGHRFALVKVINDALYEKLPENGILIQKKYLADIKKLISPEEIELNFTPKRFFIRNNDGRDMLSIPLVQFQYPDYSIFLDKMEPDTCSVVRTNRTELAEALSRNLIFNTKDENSVAITIAPDSLTLASSDKSTGSATENIPAETKSTVEHIAFITRGLLEVLSRLGSDELTVRIASESGPCSFQTDDDKNYIVIAMPVYLTEDSYYSEEEN